MTASLKECTDLIFGMDENLKASDEAVLPAKILLFGTLNGIHNPYDLYKATGYPIDEINRFVKNAFKYEIWFEHDDKLVNCEWLEGENDLETIISFWLDVLVITGQVVRVSEDKVKEYEEKQKLIQSNTP